MFFFPLEIENPKKLAWKEPTQNTSMKAKIVVRFRFDIIPVPEKPKITIRRGVIICNFWLSVVLRLVSLSLARTDADDFSFCLFPTRFSLDRIRQRRSVCLCQVQHIFACSYIKCTLQVRSCVDSDADTQTHHECKSSINWSASWLGCCCYWHGKLDVQS